MIEKQTHRSETSSKRQSLREKRRKQQRQQRNIVIIGVAIVAIFIAALIVYPQIKAASTPVGAIVMITPNPRPQASDEAAGNPNARVRIDVYEDFQCPVCRQYSADVEPQVMSNEVASGQVYYVFHNFTIIDRADWSSPNKESHQAANAAECAAAQGRFWDYHDILFANWTGENVGDFTDKRLVAFAQALNLDMTKFNACFTANTYKDKIDADNAEALKLGLNGTPSVLVNGKEITPGQVPTYDQIKQAIAAAAGQ
jgi:protein-disulfide isomerase